jgi:hypothetical protein
LHLLKGNIWSKAHRQWGITRARSHETGVTSEETGAESCWRVGFVDGCWRGDIKLCDAVVVFLTGFSHIPAVGILLVDILHDFAVIIKAPSLLAIEL